MFSHKFMVPERADGSRRLVLRITNRSKTTELAMGLLMTTDVLAVILSHAPGNSNKRYHALFVSWIAKLEELKIELMHSAKGETDVKGIRRLVETKLLNKTKEESLPKPAPPKPGTFLPFFEKHSASYERRSTRESNEYTLSVMRKFCAPEKRPALDLLNFEDINYA